MSTRCFTCKRVISNRFARYAQLMQLYAGERNPELRVFAELKVTNSCCKTKLRCHIDQEDMLLQFDTRMFAPQAPPYAVPDVKAQAEEIEAFIASHEARRQSKRKRPINGGTKKKNAGTHAGTHQDEETADTSGYLLPGGSGGIGTAHSTEIANEPATKKRRKPTAI